MAVSHQRRLQSLVDDVLRHSNHDTHRDEAVRAAMCCQFEDLIQFGGFLTWTYSPSPGGLGPTPEDDESWLQYLTALCVGVPQTPNLAIATWVGPS
jgi:hypothetical protein